MALLSSLFFLLAVGLGAALVFRGLRGIRIDDHPICRRCGFDLFGSSGSLRCGECGADLTLTQATRVGHRQRRTKPLSCGLDVLLVTGVLAGVVASGFAGQINWWRFAPLSYVLRQAGSAAARDRSPALAELQKRFHSGDFSQPSLNRVLDAGLAFQGDLARPWDSDWGDLIEDLNDAGKMSPDRVERYAKQAFGDPVKFSVTPQIRRGETLQWPLAFPIQRLAQYSNFSVSFGWDGGTISDESIRPGEWGRPGGGRGMCPAFACDGGTHDRHCVAFPQVFDGSVSISKSLAVGHHQLFLRFTRSLYVYEGRNLERQSELNDVCDFLKAQFEVLPEQQLRQK